MSRAFILVIDSLGIGASADAPSFGDDGADTLGHIAAAGGLKLPNLGRLGLGHAAGSSTHQPPLDLGFDGEPEGAWGYGVEQSRGKDTPSGHWEMAGLPVSFEWGLFPDVEQCFPEALIERLVERFDLPGILGNSIKKSLSRQ